MNFKRFQISNVQVPDDVLFLYGSRTTRSKIIQNLLQKFNIDKGQIYTKNASDKKYYKGWLSKSYVSPGVNKEGVAYLFKKQTERKTPSFLIFDNCFKPDDMDFICQVCKKAKKYGVLVILSCNRGEYITPEIGTLATCVMLTENDNKYDRKELFASFGKIFKTDRVFYKCFDYLTEDNNVMVLCENNSDDLQSQVYWYPLEGTPKDSDAPVKEEHDTVPVKDEPPPDKEPFTDSEKNPENNDESSTKNDESSTKNDDDKYEERDTCNIM